MKASSVSEELRRCAEADAERIRKGEQDAFLNQQGVAPAVDWQELRWTRPTKRRLSIGIYRGDVW